MSHSKVTILLPVYNGAKTLTRAVDSILTQSYMDWTLLVLEDGSEDETLSIAQSFEDSRIQVFSDGLHVGIVSRLNQGILLSKSPYIARMDADDVAYPERLEKQIAFLEYHSTVDLVGTAIRVVDTTGKIIEKRVFPTSHAPIIARSWLKTLSVAHPTWCGRTTWFKKWQYKDYLHNEDQEMLLRASAESNYANLPDVLLDYYETPTLSKQISARWGWITVLWAFYGKKESIGLFLIGSVVTIAKIFRSVLTK